MLPISDSADKLNISKQKLMQKLSFIVLISLSSLSVNGQIEGEMNSIKNALRQTIADLSRLSKKTVIINHHDGSVGTIRFYLKQNTIVLIDFYNYKDAYSYGEGVPLSDIHTLKKYYFIDGKLRYYDLRVIEDFYVNYKKGSRISLEESLVFFNNNERCLAYMRFETQEFVNESLDKVMLKQPPLKMIGCLYSSFGRSDINELLLLIKHK